MKKNLMILIALLMANLISVSAETKESLSTKGLCNITITVDKASNIQVITSAGSGNVLSLTDGTNALTVDDNENPLLIEPTDGAKIISVKQNGSDKNPGGDGKYRLGISEGMTLEITSQSLATEPTVTFSVDDPSHLIVKANNQVVTNISTPQSFAKGTVMTISAVGGYAIKSISANTLPSIPSVDGVYTLTVNADMTIYVYTKAVDPVITFDVDFPTRISVVNMETQAKIDISSSKASVPVGTVLEIQASDPKYGIKSVKVNGDDKQPSGGSAIYNIGVSANTTIAIETTSTVPTVKFVVDKPENIKVHLANSEERMDLSKVYELEKNTQLVIEPASNEVRIASVMANGMKLTPLGNGTYAISVSTDMTVEIKTKGILPTLTFNVDAPERINVLNGTEKLNFREPVEVPEGTQLTIEPAAGNFMIRSVVADGETLTAGADNKYKVKITGDMEFEIKTAANLTLHIVQPEGGKVSVFRNDVELHEGDKVTTGDELLFKNTPDENYSFLNYLLNGEKCIESFMVFGSEEITVSARFKAVQEGYALVTFDLDEEGFMIHAKAKYDTDDWITLNTNEPNEVKKGSIINIYTNSTLIFITSCTMNGVEMTVEKENKYYNGTINENAVIKVVTMVKARVCGELTYDATYLTIGKTFIKYNGETGSDAYVAVGETVEIIAEPLDGYEIEYYYTHYDTNTKFTENTYTVTPEDIESEIVVIKGAFKKIEDSIIDVNSLQSHYDAASMQIVTTGGTTEVYTASGEKILESADTNISLSTLKSGLYIVKTQDGVFKIVKK